MITENDIRLALKKALLLLPLCESDSIQIHLNPEDRANYLDTIVATNRSGRYTYNMYPLIANEHIAIGEVHVGVFFRRP